MKFKIYHDMSFFDAWMLSDTMHEDDQLEIVGLDGLAESNEINPQTLDDLNVQVGDEIIIGIFMNQHNIDAFHTHNLPTIAIAPDLDNIQVDSQYIFQNPEDIEKKDIIQAYYRYYYIPMFVHDFGDYYLREACLEDIDSLYALYDSPGFTDYMEPLFSRDEEIEYQRNYIRNIYGIYGYGMWLLFDKETDQLIGRFGIETRESCFEENQVDLGYGLHPDYQGQGIATEVCQWIIDYAFKELGMNSVIARVNPDNTPSYNLIRRLGFQECLNTSQCKDHIYILKHQ